MFEYWLHSEAGYSYVGENSYYKLTIPEIRRLHRGFSITKERERERMEEENPDLRKKRVRESDKRALAEFKENQLNHG